MIAGAIISETLLIAFVTPLPLKRSGSPSRNSSASLSDVLAPLGTEAFPNEPSLSWTTTSTVGLPHESKICLAIIFLMTDTMFPF